MDDTAVVLRKLGSVERLSQQNVRTGFPATSDTSQPDSFSDAAFVLCSWGFSTSSNGLPGIASRWGFGQKVPVFRTSFYKGALVCQQTWNGQGSFQNNRIVQFSSNNPRRERVSLLCVPGSSRKIVKNIASYGPPQAYCARISMGRNQGYLF